ncbi:MAG: 4a-hydroxytetrahydrobiopterin dehydratase [Kofleriaceae bacterium]|jgi:4a-hydroxytetrahydrobiopterin dehydratase|nr:4a-hydroxytetrahydrobiopterin dehydratase [Kofleriaceae bacterium]MBP9169822.1 4a-hydroxytetrahydrobiopterin dehydratase [Kofleriaceae bacterium]MBP9858087.1 4a-hydroxytetrahydrobiopterin dehydratase [Kofleriaceae bacterium]
MIDLVDRSARDVPAAAGRLSTTERLALTAGLDPAWRVIGDRLVRRFAFSDFAAAAAWAAAIAPLADAEDHHPELVVAWGRVDVTLTTHDVDGLSERDLIVAAKLDRAYATRGSSR